MATPRSARSAASLLAGLVLVLAVGPALATETLQQVATENLRIRYDPERVSARAVELAQSVGERDFARVAAFLGEGRFHSPIDVVLGGSGLRADGGYDTPRVDRTGTIFLYKYSAADEGYFTSLPHEMVHVFRRGALSGDWFIEEAFASWVSDRLAPENPGFPIYGFPIDVVAGQWLSRGDGIPLATLRGRHRELSLQCMAQSYTLRLSFFRYLGDAYGAEAVMNIAYAPRILGREPFATACGKSFAELEEDWRADLLDRYRAVEGAEELAERYRTQTPVASWKICREGSDF